MNATDLSVYIDKEFRDEPITQDFLEYLQKLYIRKMRLFSRRYRGKWEPRTREFEEFLLSIGITRRHPDILGIVERSIRLRKLTNSYILGIDPRKYYPGSKVRLIDYIRILEFGTSTMTARPLLTRVKNDLESNFKKYYLDVVGGTDLD